MFIPSNEHGSTKLLLRPERRFTLRPLSKNYLTKRKRLKIITTFVYKEKTRQSIDDDPLVIPDDRRLKNKMIPFYRKRESR